MNVFYITIEKHLKSLVPKQIKLNFLNYVIYCVIIVVFYYVSIFYSYYN